MAQRGRRAWSAARALWFAVKTRFLQERRHRCFLFFLRLASPRAEECCYCFSPLEDVPNCHIRDIASFVCERLISEICQQAPILPSKQGVRCVFVNEIRHVRLISRSAS